MTTRHLMHGARISASIAGAGLALALVACAGGYVDMGDGYDAAYVDAPVGVDAYPHYTYNGVEVYDVNGRYYQQHEGRWVAYRHVPPEVARWHSERGRAERQR